MLVGNQMEKALAAAGFTSKQRKKKRQRVFECRKCNTKMNKHDNENFMVCPECGNYFIFESRA